LNLFSVSKNTIQTRINSLYWYSGRCSRDKIYYSLSLRSSKISVILTLSANDGDDGPSLSNDAIVTTGEDSGGFDYDIVRRRSPDAP